MGHLQPVLSNQKMNAYLKEIANLRGISKTLTFHIARQLGHWSLKQTMIYAKILDVKISEDMKGLRERLKGG